MPTTLRSSEQRRSPWPGWLLGCCVLWGCGDGAPPAPTGVTQPGETPPPAEVDLSPAQVQEQIASGVQASGGATSEDHTEWQGADSYTYQRWQLDCTLTNENDFALSLGSEIVLLETGKYGDQYDGVVLRLGVPVPEGDAYPFGIPLPEEHSFYGLSNYDLTLLDGQNVARRGTMTTFTFAPEGADVPAAADFGQLAAGATRNFTYTLGEGQWITPDALAGLWIVLPELRIVAEGEPLAFRPIAYCRPAPDDVRRWQIERQKLVPLTAPGLAELVRTPETHHVERILAAQWLADIPAADLSPLTAVAQTLKEGALLAVCLDLLTARKAAGLQEHARSLLGDAAGPPGIRARAARYLAALHDEQATELLVQATSDADYYLAETAVTALGALGSRSAIEALLGILRDETRSDKHGQVAAALAGTNDPAAVNELIELARNGNYTVLEALANSGGQAAFEFFQTELRGPRAADNRETYVRGLVNCGKDRAVPVLLELLPLEPPPTDDPRYTTYLVTELARLLPADALAQVRRLAEDGNLRAAQVLANCPLEEARAALLASAEQTDDPAVQLIVTAGLADRWAADGRPAFERALTQADPRIVREGIRGLSSAHAAAALELLLPFLQSEDYDTRQAALQAVNAETAKQHGAQVLQALLDNTYSELLYALVGALIDSNYQDAGAAARVQPLLARFSGDTNAQWELIRLLRHLTDNALGPADYDAFFADPANWVQQWTDWQPTAN